MSLYVKDTGEDFEQMEMGLQQAVCSHVIDLGVQVYDLYGAKDQLALCFELAQKMKDGRPFMLSKIYTKSLFSKSSLCKDLETWRGRKFTDEERKGFDVEKLIGINCYVNIMPQEKEGRVYGKVTSINKLPAGHEVIKPIGQPAPEWLQKKANEGLKRALEAEAGNAGIPPSTKPENPADVPF